MGFAGAQCAPLLISWSVGGMFRVVQSGFVASFLMEVEDALMGCSLRMQVCGCERERSLQQRRRRSRMEFCQSSVPNQSCQTRLDIL